MRNKDQKKKIKGQESTIGKIIYGFLLFLPLFAIGSACLISTFNMASKEESEIHYKYETNEVNSNDDLIVGRAYNLQINNNQIVAQDSSIKGSIISFNVFNTNNYENANIDDFVYDSNNYRNELPYFILNKISTTIELYIWYPNGDVGFSLVSSYDTSWFEINIDFVLEEITIGFQQDNNAVITKCENIPIDYVETHNVSAQDVFYNSINKVQNSPLFNWTTNTGIYTVLNNTCNNLGITTTFVPLLLAYWLIISVMYFLYDIVLIILNILHRKIHELQESI